MTPQQQRERENYFNGNETDHIKAPCKDWKCELEKVVIELRRQNYRESQILGMIIDAFEKV